MSWVVDDNGNGNGFLMRGLKDQRCWTRSGFVLAVPVLVSLFRPTGSEQGYLLFGYFTPAKFLRFLAGCRFGDGQTVFPSFPLWLDRCGLSRGFAVSCRLRWFPFASVGGGRWGVGLLGLGCTCLGFSGLADGNHNGGFEGALFIIPRLPAVKLATMDRNVGALYSVLEGASKKNGSLTPIRSASASVAPSRSWISAA